MEDPQEDQGTYPSDDQEQTIPKEEDNLPQNEYDQPPSYQPDYQSSTEHQKESNDILDPKTIMTNTDYVSGSSMQVENVRFHSFNT